MKLSTIRELFRLCLRVLGDDEPEPFQAGDEAGMPFGDSDRIGVADTGLVQQGVTWPFCWGRELGG